MTDQPTSDPSPRIESQRVACDLDFFTRANQFAQTAIADIPELQAVAVIPLWAPHLENVPAGLLRLRDETPPYLAGLLQMLGRLAAFGVDVHRDAFTQIKAFDGLAGNLMAEIRKKTEELEKLANQSTEPR